MKKHSIISIRRRLTSCYKYRESISISHPTVSSGSLCQQHRSLYKGFIFCAPLGMVWRERAMDLGLKIRTMESVIQCVSSSSPIPSSSIIAPDKMFNNPDNMFWGRMYTKTMTQIFACAAYSERKEDRILCEMACMDTCKHETGNVWSLFIHYKCMVFISLCCHSPLQSHCIPAFLKANDIRGDTWIGVRIKRSSAVVMVWICEAFVCDRCGQMRLSRRSRIVVIPPVFSDFSPKQIHSSPHPGTSNGAPF